MLNAIREFCDDQSFDNGLLLIDMPTGFGKTYNVIEYICEKMKSDPTQKIFFVTSLKKNLPINDNNWVDMLKKKLTPAVYNDKVLFIDSNLDPIIDNLLNIENGIPSEIRLTDIYISMRREIEFVVNTPKYSMPIKEHLRREVEPKFRRYLAALLKKEYKTVSERLKAIETDNKWRWVQKLYPAVFTSKRSVIFMSMDKFLGYNDTIVEPSYRFITNKIIDKAIIFIDEFDATKETILKSIVQDDFRNRIDYIKLMNTVYSALTTRSIPSEMLQMPRSFYVNKKSNYLESKEVMTRLRSRAEAIYQKYSLNYNYKTSDSAADETNNFLFHDYKHHSILRDEKNNFVSVRKDDTDKLCRIDFISEKPKTDSANIFNMLSEIRGFISYFQGAVRIIANHYKDYKNENIKQNEDEYTIEQSVDSIISHFQISDKNTVQLIKSGIFIRSNGISKNNQHAMDLSFYERGFRYYDFVDSGNHDFQSEILMSSYNDTPEKYLVRICRKSKVVGISATASLNTVIGNYDINYLRQTLRDGFHTISANAVKEIKAEYDRRIAQYDKVNIHADFISGKSKDRVYSLDCWKEIFNGSEALSKNIFNRISDVDDYCKERYVKIARAFVQFVIHEDIKSFLCMLNKHPKENDKTLNKNVLSEIFKFIISAFELDYRLDSAKCVEYIDGEEFEKKKSNLCERLKNGEKIFAISVYQTIGAGQNIQYIIPNAINTVTVFEQGNISEKDFDAIYLDKPTNVIVNLSNSNKIGTDELAKYIFQVEFLRFNGEISQTTAIQNIKAAFRCFSMHTNSYFKKLHDTPSVKTAITRTIIQAIGRICRTLNKNPDIYIYADADLRNIIDTSTANNMCNPEYLALVEKVIQEKTNPVMDEQREMLLNKANTISDIARRYIYNMLSYEWDESSMENWKNLRGYVLAHPTLSETEWLNSGIAQYLYIKLPGIGDRYWYSESGDYDEVNIRFSEKQIGDKEVSADDARLEKMMQIDGVREYFRSQGYAVEFNKAPYIMCPVVFNSIYKGALGEVVGEFLLREKANIILHEITDPDKFEKFDYYIGDGVYVDFKHWKETFIQSESEAIAKIENKLDEVGGIKVIVINIISDPGKYSCNIGNKVVRIPYLCKEDTCEIYHTAFEAIRGAIDEAKNSNQQN